MEDMSPRGGGTTDRGQLVPRQKTAVFGTAPSLLAGTLAPQDTGTNDTIGMVSECTNVRKVGKVRSVVRCQHCRPAPANQLQIHATKYQAPGPLSLREASKRQMLSPMAIGHPNTRPHGNGCIGVDPHHGNNHQMYANNTRTSY